MPHIGKLLSKIAANEGNEITEQVKPVAIKIFSKRKGVKVNFEQACIMPCYSTLIEFGCADWESGSIVATKDAWDRYH